jgi:hypothetical protein
MTSITSSVTEPEAPVESPEAAVAGGGIFRDDNFDHIAGLIWHGSTSLFCGCPDHGFAAAVNGV